MVISFLIRFPVKPKRLSSLGDTGPLALDRSTHRAYIATMLTCRDLAAGVSAGRRGVVRPDIPTIPALIESLAADPTIDRTIDTANLIATPFHLNKRIKNTQQNIQIMELDRANNRFRWNRLFSESELGTERRELAILLKLKELRRRIYLFNRVIRADIAETKLINQLTHEFSR